MLNNGVKFVTMRAEDGMLVIHSDNKEKTKCILLSAITGWEFNKIDVTEESYSLVVTSTSGGLSIPCWVKMDEVRKFIEFFKDLYKNVDGSVLEIQLNATDEKEIKPRF